MKNIETDLQFLGLNKEEIRIYLALLQYGLQPVTGIARLTKLGRVNCYHHLEKLRAKELVTITQKHKVKHFMAENPERLINQQKERLNLAQTLVPELASLSHQNSHRPHIQFFEGEKEIKRVFDRMIDQPNGEIVSFTNLAQLGEFFPDFLKTHLQTRLQKNIKSRFISSRDQSAEVFQNQFFPPDFDPKLLEIFLISPQEFVLESHITIFQNSIAVINLDKPSPVAVVVENEALHRTQKAVFDLAWLGATSFIT